MSAGDPARSRWAVIQLVRAAGVICALTGIAILSRRVEAVASLPAWLGFILLAGGLVDVFLVPLLLARQWRSKPR